MPPKRTGEMAISSEAVRSKTGREWSEWFQLLDRWGAKTKDHATIARHLRTKYKLTPWWSQTVTVRYELERGKRVVGERSDGQFEVSVQRTIASSATKAYQAFTDPNLVSRWFTTRARADLKVGGSYSNADGDQGTFVIIEPRRRLKFTWDNQDHCPGTLVEVTFTPHGGRKVVVRLQHTRLNSHADREEMREGWSWAMDSLKSFLETGNPIRHEDWLAARESTT
ncbi:MAG: hypothetical protein Kow0074_11490 [Candidatus Zixiibacteriota bacterium]